MGRKLLRVRPPSGANMANPTTDKDLHEMQRDRDLASIKNAIEEPHGLSVEVLLWAFYACQANPTQTVAQCIQDGFDEWVK